MPDKPKPMPTKLLDQFRERIRAKHYNLCAEQTYAQWICRFIVFHDKRHPEELGAPEVEAFLTNLATEGKFSASTQT